MYSDPPHSHHQAPPFRSRTRIPVRNVKASPRVTFSLPSTKPLPLPALGGTSTSGLSLSSHRVVNGDYDTTSRTLIPKRPTAQPRLETMADVDGSSQINDPVVHDFISGDSMDDTSRTDPATYNDSYQTNTTGSIHWGPPSSSKSNWSHALKYYASHFEYTLEEFGEKIRNSASLRSAEIVKVDRHCQKAGIRHRFLVLQLRQKNKSKDIFLRLDRRVEAGINPLKFLATSGVSASNDRAFLASDEQRAIRGNTPPNVPIVHETRLIFPSRSPTLLDFDFILQAIAANMKNYRLSRENCWFFCAVCLESLSDRFNGTFAIGELNHTGLAMALELRAAIYAQLPPLTDAPHVSRPNLPRTIIPPRIHEPVIPSRTHNLLRTISMGPTPISAIAVHPYGHCIASTCRNNALQLWDVGAGTAIGKPLIGHTSWVTCITFSPNGRKIASGSLDGTIRLWDTRTGMEIGYPLIGHNCRIVSIVFSGRHIISSSNDTNVCVWDGVTGALLHEPLQGYINKVWTNAISPDGMRIVSTSDNNAAQLWDTTTGAAIGMPLIGHTDLIRAIAFSPDGRRIASGSYDQTIRTWDTATGVAIGVPLRGHSGRVISIAFSPDGRYIASGSDDTSIHIWDHSTSKILTGHTDWVRSVVFFPDGKRVASGADDGTIRIWDISP